MADDSGPDRVEDMSYFDLPWCKDLFARPDFHLLYWPGRQPPPPAYKRGQFVLFSETLWTERTIRAWCPFTLDNPADEGFPHKYCLLIALGDGLNVAAGHLCGGITATIMDLTLATAAAKLHGAIITTKLDIDFKRPIPTPCVVLCKAFGTKIEGKKCFAQCTVEDGTGKILASATSVFVRPPGEEGKRSAEWLMAALNKNWHLPRPRI